MIGNRVRLLLLSGSAAVATLCTAGTAHAQAAQTTTAGTTINNTASVSYTVNGTPQTTTSTTASFVVDRKVNFSVIFDQPANTVVNLGQANAVTTWKVTNTTNGVQDFLLDANQTLIAAGIVPGNDNFDVNNVRIFVDSNGNGQYDPGVDTATYIDELAPDASIAVFIVGDVPSTPTTISQADIALHVTAAAGGQAGTQGSALIASVSLGNADNVVDVVFADDDSDGLGIDTIRNGQGWAYGAYVITTRNVALTVNKSALVLSDPVNLLVAPKAIPGAVVQYCLLANNATLLTAANNVTLTDVVPANMTYVPGSVQVGLPGGTCTLLGAAQDDATVYNAGTRTVTVNVGTVAGGGVVAVSFRATIN